MSDDAQTALLKTLEEPPAGVTIVLCADDEDRLLPTVRSRCARIRLGPVAVRDVEAILADAELADPPLAARLARLAGGRPGLARSLAARARRGRCARRDRPDPARPPPARAGVRALPRHATCSAAQRELDRALDRAAADGRRR